MALNVWSSVGSTDGNLVGNWSLGALNATDDLQWDGTSAVNCIFSAPHDCASMTSTVAFSGNLDSNGNAATVSGTVSLTSDGSGDLIIDALITIDADGSFILGTWNTVDCTAGSIDLQGTGDFRNVFSSSIAWKKITAAAAGKKTNHTGTRAWYCQQYTGGAGEYDLNTLNLYIRPTGVNDIVLHADHNFTAATYKGCVYLYVNAAITLLLPKITILAPGTFYILQGADVVCGVQLQGAINVNVFYIRKNYNSDFTVDFNDHNVTAATLYFGGSEATGTFILNWGNGTHDFSDFIQSAGSDTEATSCNLEGSTITCGGNFTLGTNTTLDAGTSSFTFDGAAQTCTLAGETLYDVIVNNTSFTPQDAFACNTLDVQGGNFDQNGQTITSASDQTYGGAGNLTQNAAVTMTGAGNFTITSGGVVDCTAATLTLNGNGTLTADGVTFNELIINNNSTITWNAAGTITISNYTATDWDGATFVSSVPGTTYTIANPAGMTVSNMTVTDSTATNDINAYDGINTDGGGNSVEWVFEVVGPVGRSGGSVGVGLGIKV